MKRAGLVLALSLAAVPALMILAHTIAPALTERYFVQRSEAFLAFYCAGGIAARGENPYRIQPLLDCEQAEGDGMISAGIVEPAPLPGYALGFFSLFRTLPYATAAMTWAAILLMALFVATWVLARITSLPWYLIAAALAPSAGHINIRFGEIPPFCIGALCVSAYLLVHRRFAGAALAASTVMLEPHVGLAACLGLFCFVPQTRAPLAVLGIAFGSASIATLGWDRNVEFLQTVLPVHARSEVFAGDQYSLTWILHALGLPADIALRAGSISYIVMLACGLVLAKRWAGSLRSPELIVALPAAAVLIGGVFIHDIQMVIALPAALIIAARSSGIRRSLGFLGVLLIAVPWGSILAHAGTLAFLSIALVAVLSLGGRFGQAVWARGVTAGAAGALVLSLASMAPPPAPALSLPTLRSPDAQAAENWQQYIEGNSGPATPGSVGRKILVWSGFAAMLLAAAGGRRTVATGLAKSRT